MRIRVDQARCTGHGRCANTAPDLYELDEEGYCAIEELLVPAGREAAATDGASACPESAITVAQL